ncbi:MAG TPA: PspC domain-containing protein [Mycobacteriales bacterium]|nr:PspC domain-containing protein [Mycobacteriales bacterium]
MTTADMPAGERRRLTRAHDGRVVAGVCQGAARYFDIDPVIFRIVLAALTVFGGAGVIIYVVAWALIPDEASPETRLERWFTTGGRVDLRQVILLALIAVCVVIFLATAHIFGHEYGAAAVAVIAALLLTELIGRQHGHGLFPPRQAAPAPSAPTMTASATPPVEWVAAPSAPIRPRERAWLGWLTFAAVVLAVGVLALVASSGAAHPQPADVLAVCVAVAGLGLVIGAFVGRARAMIPIGLLLVAMLGIANALPRNLTWSAGTRDWAPVSGDLASSYVLGAGKADLDLTRLDPTTSATVDARLGAGRLIVTVPRGMGVVVEAKVGAGRVYLFGHEQDGTGLDEHVSASPTAHDGTLTLQLQDGFGDLEVRDALA